MASLLCAALCLGAVQTLHLQERTDYEKGKASGAAGPYERITAKATLTDQSVTMIDVLKPRDPAKGNGTLVFLMAPDAPIGELVSRGYTILQVSEMERNTVRDLISFLRYEGSPFLLGDQKQFLKRAISIVPSDAVPDIESALQEGGNRTQKGQPLVEGILVYGSGEGLKKAPGLTTANATAANFGQALDSLQKAISGSAPAPKAP